MEQDGQELVRLIEWLLAVTKDTVSPDAYLQMLKVVKGCVVLVFQRSAHAHEAELDDLGAAVNIICSRRRPEARFGLYFAKEAVAFREDEYAKPIIVLRQPPTL